MSQNFASQGIFKVEPKRQYAKNLTWHKNCVECGKENPPGMARVCSSECYVKNPLKKVDNYVPDEPYDML